MRCWTELDPTYTLIFESFPLITVFNWENLKDQSVGRVQGKYLPYPRRLGIWRL